MRRLFFLLLTSLVVPSIYEGRKYYVYNKMVNKYKKDKLVVKKNM